MSREDWAMCLALVLVLCLGVMLGFVIGDATVKRKAAREGVGMYVADPLTGRPEFVWLSPESEATDDR